jgi:hypothetical protein
MKISLITVCRNSETTIRSSIESVLYQTLPDIGIYDAMNKDFPENDRIGFCMAAKTGICIFGEKHSFRLAYQTKKQCFCPVNKTIL